VIVSVNGEHRELPAGVSVEEMVGRLSPSPRGIAVVVDGEVVPRSEWPGRLLAGRESVEVLTAVQGG
jgi:sulfur carrier protein